jgi:hypothetical protein
MKRGDSISTKFEELNQRSIDDKKDAYKFFMEQSPLARTKAEIKKHLEAAVAYRISVLTNVSTFGESNLLHTLWNFSDHVGGLLTTPSKIQSLSTFSLLRRFNY